MELETMTNKQPQERGCEVSELSGLVILPLSVGAESVAAYNDAQQMRWDCRPVCCGKKVAAFDDGAYICELCETIFE